MSEERRRTFRYRVYGLLVDSEVPLGPHAGGSNEAGEPDLRVSLGNGAAWSADVPALEWEGVCRVALPVPEVLVLEPKTASPQDLALAASGSGLALALHQRGNLVLHGSCVAIGDQGVCLLGESGAGKSTLATALQLAGHTLISDAMTVLSLGEATLPRALPGWDVVKLWPNTIGHLEIEPRELGPVHPDSEKRACAPSGVIATSPVPVSWFVTVTPGDPIELTPLAPAAGLIALVGHFYLASDLPKNQHSELLRRAARAAARSRVARLRRGTQLSQVLQVVEALEQLVSSGNEPRLAPT